jgi:folate-binding protein YgfZ
MLADLEIYRLPDGLVCSVAAGLAASLTSRLDQLIFAEDVRVTDVSAEFGELLVVGTMAAEVLGETLAISPEALGALPELAHIALVRGFVARSGMAVLPAFRVFLPVADLAACASLLDRAGTPVVQPELLEALRIERGRPLWGADLGEATIPLEAGRLNRAISTSKGCYVGQEVIIRILHRGGGRVARRLVTLTLAGENPSEAAAGGGLTTEAGAEVGTLTSVSLAPAGDRWIALGYLARDHAEVGRRVTVRGTGITATVTGFGG